jgi:RNA polymerase sigma factor (sigma-70 family)
MAGNERTSRSPSTHLTLLARLRSDGDADAWISFVDLYTPLVHRYCKSRGLQDADSRDVTQQVHASVHRAMGKFEYDRERGRFRNWLGAITVHEIERNRRKQRRPGKGTGEGHGPSVADLTAAAVDPAWIEEFNGYIFKLALDRIRAEFDAETWEVFELTWIKDVKVKEAAVQLAKPIAWTYKARYKVVERLKRELNYLTSDAAIMHKPM